MSDDIRRAALEEAATLVEWADLSWHEGDPRIRLAAAMRRLASAPASTRAVPTRAPQIQQEEAAERVLQSEAPATPTHHVIGGEGDPPTEV